MVFIIQGCLEIDHRGALPAPVSWKGKIPPPQIEVVEVIDQDNIEGLYDVAPKSISIDFD